MDTSLPRKVVVDNASVDVLAQIRPVVQVRLERGASGDSDPVIRNAFVVEVPHVVVG